MSYPTHRVNKPGGPHHEHEVSLVTERDIGSDKVILALCYSCYVYGTPIIVLPDELVPIKRRFRILTQVLARCMECTYQSVVSTDGATPGDPTPNRGCEHTMETGHTVVKSTVMTRVKVDLKEK